MCYHDHREEQKVKQRYRATELRAKHKVNPREIRRMPPKISHSAIHDYSDLLVSADLIIKSNESTSIPCNEKQNELRKLLRN